MPSYSFTSTLLYRQSKTILRSSYLNVARALDCLYCKSAAVIGPRFRNITAAVSNTWQHLLDNAILYPRVTTGRGIGNMADPAWSEVINQIHLQIDDLYETMSRLHQQVSTADAEREQLASRLATLQSIVDNAIETPKSGTDEAGSTGSTADWVTDGSVADDAEVLGLLESSAA